MAIFNSKQNIEEILKKMDDCVDSQIHVGAVFLNYRLQEKLIHDQNEYNKGQLKYSRRLVFATWALVAVTIILVFVT